jgi:hypothetical protein
MGAGAFAHPPGSHGGCWNDPGEARYRAAYFERFPGASARPRSTARSGSSRRSRSRSSSARTGRATCVVLFVKLRPGRSLDEALVHGRSVKNETALANPEALALYASRPELAED